MARSFTPTTVGQYTSIAFTDASPRLAPHLGRLAGDAYDNALAETVIGLFKTELSNPSARGAPGGVPEQSAGRTGRSPSKECSLLSLVEISVISPTHVTFAISPVKSRFTRPGNGTARLSGRAGFFRRFLPRAINPWQVLDFAAGFSLIHQHVNRHKRAAQPARLLERLGDRRVEFGTSLLGVTHDAQQRHPTDRRGQVLMSRAARGDR